MYFGTLGIMGVGLALVAAGSVPGQALAEGDTEGLPRIDFVSKTRAAVFGGDTGAGVLTLPNLGRGCRYRFKIDGGGVGLKLGFAKSEALGYVLGMSRLADFPGNYSKSERVLTLFSGGGTLKLKNLKTSVHMELNLKTEGLNFGLDRGGLKIALVDPIPSAPRKFILYFGFNKVHINKDSRATLAKVLAGWKCRYGKIKIVGHTDTVGKENYNLHLSDRRALAVMNYLVNRGGVVAGRIFPRAAGEKDLLVPTGPGVRLRSNRAAVITVE